MANWAQISLYLLEKVESVDLLCFNGLILLIIVKAAHSIEKYILKMLSNTQRFKELNDWLIFVVAEQGEVRLAQFDVQFIVHMRWVDLSRGDLVIRKLVIATETKLDHSNQLPLLFKTKISILEDLTLAEWDPDKSLILLRVKKVIEEVLEF